MLHSNSAIMVVTGLAVAALGYATWIAATEPIEISAVALPAVSAPIMPDIQPASAAKPVTLAALSETLDRPLFNVTRRPRPATSEQALPSVSVAGDSAIAPSPAVEVPVTLRLIGLMKTPAHLMRALIKADNSITADWVAVGADVSGWRVSSIDADSVVVEALGTRTVLKLYPAPHLADANK